MSNHLSQVQFEAYAFDKAGPSELEHIRECSECRAEVERFSRGLALLRRVVRDLADDSSTVRKVDFRALPSASSAIPGWNWPLATAALIAAVVLPFFISSPKPVANAPQEMSPEAVMERLNRHLAVTVPEPMEPLLSLISGEQRLSERDGTQ